MNISFVWIHRTPET